MKICSLASEAVAKTRVRTGRERDAVVMVYHVSCSRRPRYCLIYQFFFPSQAQCGFSCGTINFKDSSVAVFLSSSLECCFPSSSLGILVVRLRGYAKNKILVYAGCTLCRRYTKDTIIASVRPCIQPVVVIFVERLEMIGANIIYI